VLDYSGQNTKPSLYSLWCHTKGDCYQMAAGGAQIDLNNPATLPHWLMPLYSLHTLDEASTAVDHFYFHLEGYGTQIRFRVTLQIRT
jgi:hypothetical protein